ncbi:putative DNA-binding regulatory protein [Minicystis rosea]|nr:putative DNA-binding regulatory protein [Minicystis rosea]
MFFAALGAPGAAASPDAGAAIARAVETARAAHPDLDLDDEAFVRHLGACLAGTSDPWSALDALHLGDLWLACACLRGDPRALARLEADHLGPAIAAVGRIVDAADRDDAVQALRQKLLVADGDTRPRLADYGGRGSLPGWLKVVGARLALSRARRRRDDAIEDDELLDLPSPLHPELEHMRERYKAELKAAFQDALAALSPRERTLLRLQFLDDLGVDRIGAMYRVHRSTAARWIAQARETLFDGTRQRLAARLGIGTSQLDSILDLVRSHVDLSLQRCLGAEEE